MNATVRCCQCGKDFDAADGYVCGPCGQVFCCKDHGMEHRAEHQRPAVASIYIGFSSEDSTLGSGVAVQIVTVGPDEAKAMLGKRMAEARDHYGWIESWPLYVAGYQEIVEFDDREQYSVEARWFPTDGVTFSDEPGWIDDPQVPKRSPDELRRLREMIARDDTEALRRIPERIAQDANHEIGLWVAFNGHDPEPVRRPAPGGDETGWRCRKCREVVTTSDQFQSLPRCAE